MILYIAHPSGVSDTTGGPYKKKKVSIQRFLPKLNYIVYFYTVVIYGIEHWRQDFFSL